MVKRTRTVQAGGMRADVYTLYDGQGGEADILTFGGRVTRLTAKDRAGEYRSVIVGAADAEEYLTGGAYYGALIGRYGNRIGGARFVLGGSEYVLQNNEGPNTLHGGQAGFHNKVWDAEIAGGKLVLTLFSPHLEGGFPGNLRVKVTYGYSAGSFTIAYEAVSDEDTVINLTNHAYFNLGGGNILSHELTIHSDTVTEVDERLIPTGTLLAISGTPLAFDKKRIGKDIASDHPLIRQCNGYDFNYCLAQDSGSCAAEVYEPDSGRRMQVFTDLPAVQLYTSNRPGKCGNTPLPVYAGLCLETQGYPDAPNHANFPSAKLAAGAVYRTATEYRFSVADEKI